MAGLSFLLSVGSGIVTDYPSDFDISLFDGALVEATSDGTSVLVKGSSEVVISLPLAVVSHMIDTSTSLFLYSESLVDGVATYLGAMNINRDQLIEARVWCQVAKQMDGISNEMPPK